MELEKNTKRKINKSKNICKTKEIIKKSKGQEYQTDRKIK